MVYSFENPERFAGAYMDEMPLAELTPEREEGEIGLLRVCRSGPAYLGARQTLKQAAARIMPTNSTKKRDAHTPSTSGRSAQGSMAPS